MGTKAQWFVDELAEPIDTDPFDAPIEEVGTPIDLGSEPDLVARLAELLRAEGDLDAAAVTCRLRGRQGMCCSACPVTRAAEQSAHGALCRNGVEQERVLCLIRVVEDERAHA